MCRRVVSGKGVKGSDGDVAGGDSSSMCDVGCVLFELIGWFDRFRYRLVMECLHCDLE